MNRRQMLLGAAALSACSGAISAPPAFPMRRGVNLGNALEALVGAVYIEVGYDKTKQYVVQRVLRRYLDIHELESFDDNYKSQLLEWCQKSGRNIEYKVVAKYKSEKRDKFKVAVYVDGKKLGTADDFNKKSAEQLASERAMAAMGILTNGTLPSPNVPQELEETEDDQN